MREFLKSTRFKVLLALLAFLVGMMIYAVTKGGYAVSGASLINTVTRPFRYVSNGIADKLEGTADKLKNADEYYRENQELRAQLSELNKQLADYEELAAEVEELRKFVVIKEKHPDYQYTEPAKVLGYIANDPFKSFTIDKGEENGITPYLPVATAEGLVGIIVEVSKNTSTVRTILSPDLSVAAVCRDTNADYGIIEGTVLTAENGCTKLIHLSTDNQLKPGYLMATSGNSGLFPRDYPIGTVRTTGFEANGLSACAEIEPCVDIGRLSSVVVITDFTGKKEDSDADQDLP
ncbi:MAG TPA: rod shape-determining protein MreC [Ruminococcus sp.]|nr:rod shape-determining protein MreC [Ruminococcus sp.]